MNPKYLAIFGVIIIVAAGLGAYAFILNDDDKDDKVKETNRLLVYGNVNNDDVIDNKDLSMLKDIINGDEAETRFADVNADGKLDQADVTALEAIINGTATSVKYYNAMYGKPYEVKYPLNRVVIASPELTMYMILLGLNEKIVGTAKLSDAKLFDSVKDMELWEVNKAYQWNVGVTKVSNVQGGVDAVITTTESYAMNTESSFEIPKIPVVRLDVRGTSSISAALMLGFLLNAEENAHKFVKFIDETQKNIDKKLKNVEEDKKVSAIIVGSKEVYGDESGFNECIKLAGGKVDVSISGTSRAVADGTEWINNIDPDFVLAYTTVTKYDYSESNAKTYWGTFTSAYSSLDAVPDNFAFVGYYLPDTLRAAYLVTIFYPDLFDADYGDKIHQEYVDTFLPALKAQNYDVTKDGNFLITKSEMTS